MAAFAGLAGSAGGAGGAAAGGAGGAAAGGAAAGGASAGAGAGGMATAAGGAVSRGIGGAAKNLMSKMKGSGGGSPNITIQSGGGSDKDKNRSSKGIRQVEYKRGGKIRKAKSRNKAVPIIAHENERVIPADKRKPVERLMKRAGMNLTDKKRKKGNREKRYKGRQ